LSLTTATSLEFLVPHHRPKARSLLTTAVVALVIAVFALSALSYFVSSGIDNRAATEGSSTNPPPAGQAGR
jgi:hypothetical protein